LGDCNRAEKERQDETSSISSICLGGILKKARHTVVTRMADFFNNRKRGGGGVPNGRLWKEWVAGIEKTLARSEAPKRFKDWGGRKRGFTN